MSLTDIFPCRHCVICGVVVKMCHIIIIHGIRWHRARSSIVSSHHPRGCDYLTVIKNIREIFWHCLTFDSEDPPNYEEMSKSYVTFRLSPPSNSSFLLLRFQHFCRANNLLMWGDDGLWVEGDVRWCMYWYAMVMMVWYRLGASVPFICSRSRFKWCLFPTNVITSPRSNWLLHYTIIDCSTSRINEICMQFRIIGLLVRFFLTFCRVNLINLSRRYWEGCIRAWILITSQAKKGRCCLQFFWQSQHWWAAERGDE